MPRGMQDLSSLQLLLLSRFSYVQLCATSQTAAHLAPCPWDLPGKNTGVGCEFLLQCMKVKSESDVTQSCLTLRDPVDCSLPGSSVHWIFQARVLEWVAIAFAVSSLIRDQTCVTCNRSMESSPEDCQGISSIYFKNHMITIIMFCFTKDYFALLKSHSCW